MGQNDLAKASTVGIVARSGVSNVGWGNGSDSTIGGWADVAVQQIVTAVIATNRFRIVMMWLPSCMARSQANAVSATTKGNSKVSFIYAGGISGTNGLTGGIGGLRPIRRQTWGNGGQENKRAKGLGAGTFARVNHI